jgi:hypothetical protein
MKTRAASFRWPKIAMHEELFPRPEGIVKEAGHNVAPGEMKIQGQEREDFLLRRA